MVHLLVDPAVSAASGAVRLLQEATSDLSNSEALGAAYASLAFFFLLAVGLASTPAYREGNSTFEGLLLARGTVGWAKVGFSIFAGAMGAWVVYAVPEVGVLLGPWGVMGYAASLILPFYLVAFLAPRVKRLTPNAFTALDFVRDRYGLFVYYMLWLAVIIYLFIFLVAEYTSAGGVVQAYTGYMLASWKVNLGVAIITSAYTAYGGLGVSIVTDVVQAGFVIVLVVIGCIAAIAESDASSDAISGSGSARWTDSGFEGLVVLVLALFGATLFDTSVWQRVIAARTQRDVWLGMTFAVGLILPVMFLFGFAGIVGSAVYPEDSLAFPYLSFFLLVGGMGKAWKGILVVLAVSLVCSTADSLQNALTTMVAVELDRIGGVVTTDPRLNRAFVWLQKHRLWVARFAALLIQGPAIGFALGEVDVLRVFLVADLVLAAVVVPVFAGLWDFVTPTGAVLGMVWGFASVVWQGMALRGNLAEGFRQISLPAGLYPYSDDYSTTETLVSFLLALCCSTVACFGASWAERVYLDGKRSREYLAVLAGDTAGAGGGDGGGADRTRRPSDVDAKAKEVV